MLRCLLIFALAVTHIQAQRGYGGSGYRGEDGDWGENEEPPAAAQIVTQTQVQTKVQTQIQTQVRTMVSTSLSMASTTVVQVQATTVVKVDTIVASAITPSSSISPTPTPPSSAPTLSTSASPGANPDQSQSPLQQSEGGLTVADIPPSPSPTQGDERITTRPIGAASEVSAPITRLTGTVATLKSGMEFRTTGTPNLGQEDKGVVYGHTTGINGGERTVVSDVGLIGVAILVTILLV